MPLLLRKIRKSKWYDDPELSWLKADDLQADVFGDLKTTDNRLSVWRIEDDKSNLDEVVIGLAASCDDASNLDYALFDEKAISTVSIKMEQAAGNTPCEKANRAWHRDLIELSADKLSRLASLIKRNSEKNRVSRRQILFLLQQAAATGLIHKEKLSEGLRRSLE